MAWMYVLFQIYRFEFQSRDDSNNRHGLLITVEFEKSISNHGEKISQLKQLLYHYKFYNIVMEFHNFVRGINNKFVSIR